MKKLGLFLLLVGLVATGAAFACDGCEAHNKVFEGKVVCAKCALKEEGRDKCQNVLAVEEKGKDTQYYYIAASEAGKEFKEVCMSTPEVRVTGSVEDRDGQMWIVAKKIEELNKG